MSDADFGSKFTHQVYEVLSEDTKKYTSTTVGGGGGSVMGSGGYVSGSTNAVTSRVDYHSDQDVWVKNIATGKERKLQFNGNNIDARPGHKVLCVWEKNTDRLERVANLNTGTISYVNGVHHFYHPSKLTFFQRVVFVFQVLVGIPIGTAPFVSVILLLFIKPTITGEGFFFSRDKFLSSHLCGAIILYVVWTLLDKSYELVSSPDFTFSDYQPYWITSILILYFIIMFKRIYEVSRKRANRDNLDAYVSKLMNNVAQ